MTPSTFPELPWQRIGMHLFKRKKLTYLIIMYYFSRFIEIVQLHRTTAEAVLWCKNIFLRHSIPKKVVTDNGLQFDFNAFRRFSLENQFCLINNSLYYPRSNGEAKWREKTVKALLKKGDDPYLALLAYRSTPLPMGNLLQSSWWIGILKRMCPGQERLRNLIFWIGRFGSKGRRSWDGNKKIILIDITGLRICLQHFLEIWYGYLTGENGEP